MYMNRKISLSILSVLTVTALIVTASVAQEASTDSIQGTIKVTEGDDFESLAQISLEEAQAVALREVPAGAITESELDDEDGYLVYEIELLQDGQEFEVLVDAGNGAVLEVERDDDSDDDDDDDDDDHDLNDDAR